MKGGQTTFFARPLPGVIIRGHSCHYEGGQGNPLMGHGDERHEPTPDAALMLRVRDGDDEAFAVLYRRHHRRVANFFYGLCRNAHAADDLCQETFLRVWKLKQRYAATGSFTAYLFTFARNIWLEKCRDYRRQARLGFQQDIDVMGEILEDPRHAGPDAAAQHNEVAQSILDAVDGLPEEQRMVFVLRVVEGMPIEEIAIVMNCPANTVRSRKILALKKLREVLRNALVL